MDLKEFALSSGSQRHPWEQSRAAFLAFLVRKHLSGSGSINFLDVGSGDMWLAKQFLRELPAGSRATCVDPALTPQIAARTAAGTSIEALSEIPEGRRYDAVFLLDVLEHVENDRGLLGSIAINSLQPDGQVFISVPAYQRLFTQHDAWLGHYRRYSRKTGHRLVTEAGLRVQDDGFLFHGLIYIRAVEKLLERLHGVTERRGISTWSGHPAITGIVTAGLNLDWRVSEALRALGIRLPGLSWWCVCKRA